MDLSKFDPGIWLNNVRAVPSIGIRYPLSIDTSSSIVQRLKPLLTRWHSNRPLKIETQTDNSVKIERQDGIEVIVGNYKLACKYYYVSEVVEKGYLEPILRYPNPRLPYVEVCQQLQTALLEVYGELCKDGNRVIEFAGVVAEGNLDPDGLPPGFAKLFDYVGRPWELGLSELSGRFLSVVGESGENLDRCHHVVNKKAGDEDVVDFKLDWQRVWKSPEAKSPSKMKEVLEESVSAAVEYFGRFGMGDLRYGT